MTYPPDSGHGEGPMEMGASRELQLASVATKITQ